jgi:hypothetical protein
VTRTGDILATVSVCVGAVALSEAVLILESRHGQIGVSVSPEAVVHLLCLCEIMLIAALSPFWASGRGGVLPSVGRLLILQVALSLMCGPALLAGRSFLWIALARSQVIGFGFGLLLIGLTRLLRRATRRSTAQLTASTAGLLMCGTIFYANVFVEGSSGALKSWLIRATIAPNPIVAVTAGAFRQDILRSSVVYPLSVIGQFYRYDYVNWAAAAGAFAAVGVLCALFSRRQTDET